MLKKTSMVAGDVEKEVMRFVSTTRKPTRMSMMGSGALKRDARREAQLEKSAIRQNRVHSWPTRCASAM
jgi:hypothetical protein